MKRLVLLFSLLALCAGGLTCGGIAQASTKLVDHYAPSDCGNPTACGYYDYDRSSGGYSNFNTYESSGYHGYNIGCCAGHSHWIWEQMSWGPPGCFKSSGIGAYTTSNTTPYHAGTLALVNYSCGGKTAIIAEQTAFNAALVGDKGFAGNVGDGSNGLPACTQALNGTVYHTASGHAYQCWYFSPYYRNVQIY